MAAHRSTGAADVASLRDTQATTRESGGRARRRPNFLGELLIVWVLVFAYDRIRDLAQTQRALSMGNARDIMSWERLTHIDLELPFNVWLSSHQVLAEVTSWYYQIMHLTVTLAVLAACYALRPDAYRSARNALVAINAIGLVVFWLFPVAPPRLLPGGGFVDTTVITGAASAVSTNPYAAMPSLHIAWAAWAAMVALLIARRRAWYTRLIWAYPIVTTVVVVGTGNHYILDVVAGLGVAVLAATVPGSAAPLLLLARSPRTVSHRDDDVCEREPELAA